MSALESTTQITLGFTVSVLVTIYILPLMVGVSVSLSRGIEITAVYTILSFLRQIIVRRWFNRLDKASVNE
jgi:hypothetical protein